MPGKETVRRPVAHEGIPMGHVENHWENKLLRVDGTMERDAFSASLFRHSGNLTVILDLQKPLRKRTFASVGLPYSEPTFPGLGMLYVSD